MSKAHTRCLCILLLALVFPSDGFGKNKNRKRRWTANTSAATEVIPDSAPAPTAPTASAIPAAQPTLPMQESVEAATPISFEVAASSSSSILFYDGYSLLFLNGGIQFMVFPGIQLGLDLLYAQLSLKGVDSDIGMMGLMIGPVLNFPFRDDVQDSFYLAPKIGLVSLSRANKSDDSKQLLSIAVGKRFKITEGITFKPEIGIVNITDIPHSIYRVSPISFSLFF